MPSKIAVLGWGSLLWDHSPGFDGLHEVWLYGGPELRLEFSRISTSRGGALTLVIDSANGSLCRVAYAMSKRHYPEDAICDLKARESTTRDNIGFYFADGSRYQGRDQGALRSIRSWVAQRGFDVVVWTDLESNFQKKNKLGREFSVECAISYLNTLDDEGKAKAYEYLKRAPEFVDTPLRRALKTLPWPW